MLSLHLTIGLVFLALMLIGILELVRRKMLSERYSLLWLASAVTMFFILIFYNVFLKIVRALKVQNPPTLLLILSFFFLMLIVLHYSLVITKLSNRTRRLAQRMAILEQRLAELGGQTTEGDETG